MTPEEIAAFSADIEAIGAPKEKEPSPVEPKASTPTKPRGNTVSGKSEKRPSSTTSISDVVNSFIATAKEGGFHRPQEPGPFAEDYQEGDYRGIGVRTWQEPRNDQGSLDDLLAGYSSKIDAAPSASEQMLKDINRLKNMPFDGEEETETIIERYTGNPRAPRSLSPKPVLVQSQSLYDQSRDNENRKGAIQMLEHSAGRDELQRAKAIAGARALKLTTDVPTGSVTPSAKHMKELVRRYESGQAATVQDLAPQLRDHPDALTELNAALEVLTKKPEYDIDVASRVNPFGP